MTFSPCFRRTAKGRGTSRLVVCLLLLSVAWQGAIPWLHSHPRLHSHPMSGRAISDTESDTEARIELTPWWEAHLRRFHSDILNADLANAENAALENDAALENGAALENASLGWHLHVSLPGLPEHDSEDTTPREVRFPTPDLSQGLMKLVSESARAFSPTATTVLLDPARSQSQLDLSSVPGASVRRATFFHENFATHLALPLRFCVQNA